MKIHESSALGAKRNVNVTRSVPDVKVTRFAKRYLDVLKMCFFVDFVEHLSRIFDEFHGFSQISSFLRIVLNTSEKQIVSKYVQLVYLVWIRAIFG